MPKHPFKLGPKEQLPLQLLGISRVSEMDGATIKAQSRVSYDSQVPLRAMDWDGKQGHLVVQKENKCKNPT